MSLPYSIISLFKFNNIFTTKYNGRFAFLDIFRFIALCWVVINHLGSEGRLDILRSEKSGDLFKQNIHEHPIFGPLLGNSALGVEIFLFLSGFLAARSWQRHRSVDSPFWLNASGFLFRRWLRLAPPTLAFIYIAAGPLGKWALPQFYHSMVSNCSSKQLFSHALFINNFSKIPTCMGWLWYLGLDWQCYLLTPFLLYLLEKRPRFGISLLIIMIGGSVFIRGWHCKINEICNNSDVDIPFVYFPNISNDILQTYSSLFSLYARPTTKIGPFLIGLIIGYFTTLKETFLLKPKTSKLLFFGGFLLLFLTIYGILPEYWYPNQGNTLYNTLYTATFRTIFTVGIAFIVISVLYGERSSRPISRIWSIFAQLTFSAFLVHMPVVFLFNYISAFQRIESVYGLLLAFPFALILTFFVALIFHCFIEKPLAKLFLS
uniref:Acyltransferase 3 domain-containing protein n=2 Tax=Meloidogyne incognita TaxID=6306 RepID=A0A914MFH8_MELIC